MDRAEATEPGLLPQRQGNWQEGVGELASTFVNPMTAAAVAGPKLYAIESQMMDNAMAPREVRGFLVHKAECFVCLKGAFLKMAQTQKNWQKHYKAEQRRQGIRFQLTKAQGRQADT